MTIAPDTPYAGIPVPAVAQKIRLADTALSAEAVGESSHGEDQ